MVEIKVDDMRFRNKPGYVAKIVGGEKQFLHGECEDHGASTKHLTFNIDEDGIYEVCDANFGSRKRNISFVKITNGEVERETETLNELMADDAGVPALEGSPKQVDWAISIRAKYLADLAAKGKPTPDWVNEKTSAKFWIDNRSQMGVR